MTQPPPASPSPWAPPGSAWAPPHGDPPPLDSDTAVIPAVEPDTAAIQVDPSQADTAAHPHVADRGRHAQGPRADGPRAQGFQAPAPPMPGQPMPTPASFPQAPPPGFTPPPPGHAIQTAPGQTTPGPPQTADRPTTTKGWWRRNLWGLVALLPVLALAIGPSVKESLDLYNRVDAHEAVLAGADGWVSYSGVRMRLVDFGPATDLTTYDDRPWQPPPNTRVWLATIAIDAGEKWATDKYAVAGCVLGLEDTEGRRFTANPSELSGSNPSRRVASCSPEEDTEPTPWEVEVYFVLPESAQPAALRIVRGTELPRYARFPVS